VGHQKVSDETAEFRFTLQKFIGLPAGVGGYGAGHTFHKVNTYPQMVASWKEAPAKCKRGCSDD
jgi:hypothetical protein